MNMRVLSFLSAVLLCGCTKILTNTKEVEPGIYEITAHANVFNTKDTMLGAALQKAEKKCGHANFKQIGKPTLGNTRVYQTEISGYTNTPNIAIKVDCNNKSQ